MNGLVPYIWRINNFSNSSNSSNNSSSNSNNTSTTNNNAMCLFCGNIVK